MLTVLVLLCALAGALTATAAARRAGAWDGWPPRRTARWALLGAAVGLLLIPLLGLLAAVVFFGLGLALAAALAFGLLSWGRRLAERSRHGW
jgi:small-conductance mechanosensitive channel